MFSYRVFVSIHIVLFSQSPYIILWCSNDIADKKETFFFRNELNKINIIGARMLNSINHMTLRLLWNLISAVKKRYNFVIMYATLLWTHH